MKKTLFTLFAASLFFVSHAQVQKGNVLIGGNFANVNLGLNDPNVISFDISPKVAWFVRDNTALGGYLNFGLQSAKHTATTTTYGVGLLGRQYLGKQSEVLSHLRMFGEATVGFGGVNVTGAGNTNGAEFSVGPGITYFITPNIGVEMLLKYNGLAGFGSTPYQSNLNLSYGLQIYLPGKSTAERMRKDAENAKMKMEQEMKEMKQQ